MNILISILYFIFPYYPPRLITSCRTNTIKDLCDIKYRFINTLPLPLLHSYIYSIPGILISWVLWAGWSIFPLLNSSIHKILSISSIYLIIIFTLVLANDFIVSILFIFILSFTMHYFTEKQGSLYKKVNK